eukprot:TRINITY_DN8461_c0_g2_i2.p1 TRINITY_DN8461_c0_g2~~TRINITY_DN8461_c0_g2_i2.p1  ORF type:complete len:329 (-),score=59.40 TRINITY_DN8461_c0_g2_i2:339-1325(-)
MESDSDSARRILFGEGGVEADMACPKDDLDILDSTVDTTRSNTIFCYGAPPPLQPSRNLRGFRNRRLDTSSWLKKKQCLYDDEQVLLALLKTNPFSLEFASDELRAKIEVVEYAVSEAGMALQFASPSLREDRDLVLRAVATNVHALQFVGPALRADTDFALQVIGDNVQALSYLPEFFASLSDRAMAEDAMQRNTKCFEMLPEEWRDDYRFAEQAILEDGLALQQASQRLRSTKAFVLLSLARNGEALQYVLGDCRNDTDVVACAVLQTCYALKHVPAEEDWNPFLLQIIREHVTFPSRRWFKGRPLSKDELNLLKWKDKQLQLIGS